MTNLTIFAGQSKTDVSIYQSREACLHTAECTVVLTVEITVLHWYQISRERQQICCWIIFWALCSGTLTRNSSFAQSAVDIVNSHFFPPEMLVNIVQTHIPFPLPSTKVLNIFAWLFVKIYTDLRSQSILGVCFYHFIWSLHLKWGHWKDDHYPLIPKRKCTPHPTQEHPKCFAATHCNCVWLHWDSRDAAQLVGDHTAD